MLKMRIFWKFYYYRKRK